MSPPAEPPLPAPGVAGEPCHACRAPLASDQRHCLECGARRGAGGPIDFGALLRGSRAVGAPVARPRWLPAGAQVPVAATMVLALLVTGILLGSLGAPAPSSSAAAEHIAIAYAPPPAAAVAAATLPVVPPPPAVLPVIPAPQSPPPPPAVAVVPAPPAGTTTTTPPPPPPGDTSTSTTTTGKKTGTDDSSKTGDDARSPIEHVIVIMLAEQSYPSAFTAAGGAPYLSGTLVPDGTLLRDLRTVSGSGLANSIALVSGQAPNPHTAAGCPTFADVAPGTIGPDDQAQGEGCVYSVQTATLANQLEREGLTWRAYVEDQGNGGAGIATACRHPEVGAADPWRDARPGDAFASARNPFVYFHAVIDSKTCADNVVGLDKLEADLALAPAATPALSYVVPNLCHDGRAAPCMPDAPSGPAAADAFLAAIAPKIRASKAYARALLIVTFEHAAVATPGAADGGGKVGALLLSPFVRKGRTVTGGRDTYSLLATIQRIFALDPLGKSARPYGDGLLGPAG